jgi:hypothetical protein
MNTKVEAHIQSSAGAKIEGQKEFRLDRFKLEFSEDFVKVHMVHQVLNRLAHVFDFTLPIESGDYDFKKANAVFSVSEQTHETQYKGSSGRVNTFIDPASNKAVCVFNLEMDAGNQPGVPKPVIAVSGWFHLTSDGSQ